MDLFNQDEPKVYVGTLRFPFGRMIMFHMASADLNALHAMADKIGVDRKHFQDDYRGTKMHHPHYDICKEKKALAIRHGAIEIHDKEIIRICFPKLHAWGKEPL